MIHELLPDELMARSLLDALRPLLRRLNAERTLSPGKLGVLSHLAERGRATSSELAAVVHVSPQAISLSTGELERSGFVVRVPDAGDRRRAWIEITDAGRQKLVQELAAGHAWIDREIVERMTPEERAALQTAIPVLRKLGSWVSVD
ncbi:MarR family transcriptional regulator [Pseudarthrobacter sp. fls2-241-R2A-168]|uniref:MarR family winged helix-turn-helix transcriptional regulator n=1 Tax=Pseudarthrobacter sp. fls2-241-R2A-168 TaxID=3040304 RepID=UPI0025562923|nr:MarR family transcriptional regulator [Pseudarthrobacter sp. fls2-241-R2A-168]